MSETTTRRVVSITRRAAALLKELKQRHGPLLFHMAGGCCDGTVPVCLRRSEFRIGARDLLLDTINEVPFYVDESLFQYLHNQKILLDAVPALSDSFSLETAKDMRFVTGPADPSGCQTN